MFKTAVAICALSFLAASGQETRPGAPPSIHPSRTEINETGPRPPRPFKPDPPETRRVLAAFPVNTSFGDWRNIGPSNFGGKVYAIAVDPRDSSSIYVATEVGGLWGTHNGGQSWIPMYDGTQNVAFSSVRTHPTIPGLVAAGLIAYGGGYFRSFNKNVGIVLSTDAGNTWRNIGPSSDASATVWEIAFGDTLGRVIYAPTDRGLYKTTNQGASWTKILNYSDGSFFDGRPSFAVSPSDANVLLLAQRSTGVMRSTNGGSTWTRVDNWVNPATERNSTLLAWSSANPSYVYALAYTRGSSETLTTYISSNGGQSWSRGPTCPSGQGMYDMSITVDPFSERNVLIANSGTFSSTDGLQTLSPVSAPVYDNLAVAFDPSVQGIFYQGGDNGTYRGTRGVASPNYARFDVGMLTNKSIGGSGYSIGGDGRIWENPADYGGQTYWPDGGWLKAPTGYEYNRYYVSPLNPNKPYVWGWNSDLYRAATWYQSSADIDPQPGAQGNFLAFDFDPGDAGGSTFIEGKTLLYKTTNGGTSWSRIGISGSAGLIQAVRMAPSNPQHIYGAANDVIWYTTNGGGAWTRGATVPGLQMIAVSPASENTLFIATSSGLYKSTNGGASASQVPGIPAATISWVTVDPMDASRIYASVRNGGPVLVSQNEGGSWEQLGRLLPLVEIDWMAVRNGNLALGSGASTWEMNLQRQPLCNELNLIPPAGMTAPSSAGSYPIQLFIASSCSWTATSNVNWATVDTHNASSGYGLLSVSLSSNTSGATRNGTLTLAGRALPITQLGAPDPVMNGAVVTLRNAQGCLSRNVSSNTLSISACDSQNTSQQFSLQMASPQNYFVINSGNCVNVYYGAGQIGSLVAGYPCGYASNETFAFQPQANGSWLLMGMDSRLCLSSGSAGSTLQLCSSTDATETFTISQLNNPVQNGAVVNLSNGSGCLTRSADQNLFVSACSPGNLGQKFTLQLASGTNYFAANSGSCIDVYGNVLSPGARVAGWPCNYAGNERFDFQYQTNGSWLLKGANSQLCVSSTGAGSTQQACDANDLKQAFNILRAP